MKRAGLLGVVLVFGFISIAYAGDIKVINTKSGFPRKDRCGTMVNYITLSTALRR